jgi:hypothetical protein
MNVNMDMVPTAVRNRPRKTASPESAAIKNSAQVNAATASAFDLTLGSPRM